MLRADVSQVVVLKTNSRSAGSRVHFGHGSPEWWTTSLPNTMQKVLTILKSSGGQFQEGLCCAP